MPYPKIVLKNNCDRRILAGHLWTFSNEIEQVELGIEPGAIADLYSKKNRFLGRGFYNPHSLIAVRLLTFEDQTIDSQFFLSRIKKARTFRDSLFLGEHAYRLIFGESDFLPGLVVDRFDKTFVIQSNCLGMDLLFEKIAEALKEVFEIECLIKKNDSSLRSLENLPIGVEVVEGKLPLDFKIFQTFKNQKLGFLIDPLAGQKTGFFFDQRENRERLAEYVKEKSVLDCFSYTGAFGIYAAKSGAKEVTAIESSPSACELLQKNAALNEAQIRVIKKDVFLALDEFKKENIKFDIIVLDPPAFAKSKKNMFGALRKYRKLNQAALSLLKEEGILFSSSCSHHISKIQFLEMLSDAASYSKRQIQLLEMRGQGRDHPVLLSMPETDYLKSAILRVN